MKYVPMHERQLLAKNQLDTQRQRQVEHRDRQWQLAGLCLSVLATSVACFALFLQVEEMESAAIERRISMEFMATERLTEMRGTKTNAADHWSLQTLFATGRTLEEVSFNRLYLEDFDMGEAPHHPDRGRWYYGGIQGIDMTDAVMRGGSISLMNFHRGSFSGTKFYQTEFKSSRFRYTSFASTTFDRTAIIDAMFDGASFRHADFAPVSLEGSRFPGVSFAGAFIELTFVSDVPIPDVFMGSDFRDVSRFGYPIDKAWVLHACVDPSNIRLNDPVNRSTMFTDEETRTIECVCQTLDANRTGRAGISFAHCL